MNDRKAITLLCTAGLLMTNLTACTSERSGSGLFFENLDTNENGKISLQEFVAKAPAMKVSPEEVFSMLDGNKDGTISQDEF